MNKNHYKVIFSRVLNQLVVVSELAKSQGKTASENLERVEIKTASNSTALSCVTRCDVVTKAGKTPQRVLLTFSAQAQQTAYQQLTIYDAQNQYHADFIALTKDFYLAW